MIEDATRSMIDPGLTALCVLAVVLATAVYLELKENRIPNWLTVSGMGAGLMLGYLPWGLSLQSSVGGLCIGFGFLFLFYVFGGIGGGDVKLMGAVGALLGHKLIVNALFYTAIIGAFMAVMALIWRKSSWEWLGRKLRGLIRGERPEEKPAGDPPSATTIPYGMAIAGGCLLALFLGGA